MNNGHLDKAKVLVDRVLQEHPDYAEAWANRALIYFSTKNSNSALADIGNALKIKPHQAAWWHLFVTLQLEAGNLGVAIRAQQNRIKLEPNEAEHQAVLGELLRRAGHFDASIQVLTQAAIKYPGHYGTWVNLGAALQETYRINEAQQAYQRALQINPKSAEIASNLGALAKEMENWPLALKYLEQALSIQPENTVIADNKLTALIHLKKYQAAEEMLSKALASRPESGRLWLSKASLEFRNGNIEEALAYTRKAVSLEFSQLKQRSSAQLIDKSKKPMSVPAAGESLIALHELLTRLQIPYFIAFGTLLGIVRDGELLPFDKDMDIGLSWDIDRYHFMDQIEADGTWLVKGREYLEPDALQWKFAVIHKKTGVLTDFFFFKPDGDKLLSGLRESSPPLLWSFSAFELGVVNYRGVDLPAPANPEKFMLEIYGEDWRIPNPYFDSVVVGCNLTSESRINAIHAGWSKLYGELDKFAWKKAWGYCQQLLRYGEDPLLEELAQWCLVQTAAQKAQ